MAYVKMEPCNWYMLIVDLVGIFSDAKITPRGNPLDTLCAALEDKMTFQEGERDMIVSLHRLL